MGMCKGNLGNLMQHWVLCEVFDFLKTSVSHVQLTCTHSMAPWTVPEPVDYSSKHSPRLHRRRYFDLVRNRMVENAASVYEKCWLLCSSRLGLPYPSSAVFAQNLWPHKLSLFLCEANQTTVKEIDGWLNLPEVKERLDKFLVHQGDWRNGLTAIAFAESNTDVHFVELDPMQFERRSPANENSRNGALLYPDDIDRLVQCFRSIEKPIILQLSSYDVNNNNSLADVEPAICDPLIAAGFSLSARVCPNSQMISLVFSRGLSMWHSPDILGQRFNQWLSR